MSEEKVKKTLSIDDLNASKKCEEGFEFEFIDENGDGTGFFITVIGSQAPSVKKVRYARANKEQQHNEMLKKRGKDIPFKPVEDLVASIVSNVSCCIVGWRGIKEDYSPELAEQICDNNDAIFEQVKAASENIQNFTKSK